MLNEKVVFVGGATISFYADRPVFETRPTDDIDVIIEILNYYERGELEKRLQSLGFLNDMESGIICRYVIQGTIVNIMPTNDLSIGFKNIWYPDGFVAAIGYRIDERNTIKILSAPYFVATKLEAHKGRGKQDGRSSKDFEDIVYVLENRESIWEEMKTTSSPVKKYLQSEFSNLLTNPNIFEWIDCHVERGSPPATYFIINQLQKFTSV